MKTFISRFQSHPYPAKLRELFGIDLRSLALFRITLGLALFHDLLWRCTNLVEHLSDHGVQPRSSIPYGDQFQAVWSSPFFWSGSGWVAAVLLVLAMIFALALTVGYKTRAATVLSWFLWGSLVGRTMFVNTGADTLMLVLLFWSIFLPLGSHFSLDQRLANRNSVAHNPPRRPWTQDALNFATASALIQVGLIYIFAWALKSGSAWHPNYTAVVTVVQAENYANELSVAMQYLPPQLLKGLALATYWGEFLAPLLLFCPFGTRHIRLWVTVGLMLLHCGFGFVIQLGLFPIIDVVALILFVPKHFWEGLSRFGWLKPFLAVRVPSRKKFSLPLFDRWVSWLENGFVGFCLALVLIVNFATLNSSHFKLPPILKSAAAQLRLSQNWGLFAPHPSRHISWVVPAGTLQNGEVVNLLTGQSPVSWQPPVWIFDSFRTHRNRKFFYSLNGAKQRHRLWKSYAAFLCRDWNQAHSGKQQVQTLNLYLMKSMTFPNDNTFKTRPARFQYIKDYACP